VRQDHFIKNNLKKRKHARATLFRLLEAFHFPSLALGRYIFVNIMIAANIECVQERFFHP